MPSAGAWSLSHNHGMRSRAGTRVVRTIAPTLEDGLRALREAAEMAPSIRVELTAGYLRLIAEVEARSENQAGADKSGRLAVDRSYRDFFHQARPTNRTR